jgi:hypothetical protein
MKSAGFTIWTLALILILLVPKQTVHHWFIHHHDANSSQTERTAITKCTLDDLIVHQQTAFFEASWIQLWIPQQWFWCLPNVLESLVSNVFLFSSGRAPPALS